MTLLELARKWLRPGAKAEGDEQAAEERDFRKRAGEIWLAYHNQEAWARRKLEAGLVLTAEALAYMERELESRAAQAAHDAEIKKEVEAENVQPAHNADPVPPTPPGGS